MLDDERARRLPPAWWAALFGLALGVAWSRAYVNGDAYLYIAHGRFIFAHGALPETDPFSYTSVQAPLVLHMLMCMLGFAWLDELGGPPLVALVAALGGAVSLLALARCAGGKLVATLAAVVLVGLLVSVDRELFEARAQNFAHLFFLAELWLLRRVVVEGRVRAALLVVPLASAWASFHPSFLLAVLFPALVAAALLFEPARARADARMVLPLAGLALAGSLISPYGFALVVDVVRLVSDPSQRHIDHMQSPPLTLPWLAWSGAIVVVVLARAIGGPRARRRADVIVALALLFATLYSRRYAYFTTAFAVTLLPGLLTAAELRARSLWRALAVVTGALALAVGARGLVVGRDVYEHMPDAAISVLEASVLPDHVLTEFAWAGYAMYRFGEDRPVLIDGRNNLYRNGVFEDYLRIKFAAPATDLLLDVYQVGTVVWPSGWELDEHLAARAGTWREVYRDEKAVIYTRR